MNNNVCRISMAAKRIFFSMLLGVAISLPMHAFTVVIDPGHGGDDPGAIGRIAREKTLNLNAALQLGEMIKEAYPEVDVIFTRKTDVFIPLRTRADIANKNKADLFISIHANASDNRNASGAETFVLGTDRMEDNLDIAMRENAVIKLEADYKTTYAGFDPNSIDSYIMFELMQNSYMDQSLRFAEQVQQRFVGHLNRSDRGVRQAAFWVLLKTACPSILFEMGFISNPEEEKFLNQPASMAQMANALVNAFGAYTHKQAVKKESLAVEESIPTQPGEPKSESQEPTAKPQEPTAKPQQPQTYFAIQICASKTPLQSNDARLKGQVCECTKVGEWYKYYTAADTDRSKVMEARKQLLPLFPDCWIIKVER